MIDLELLNGIADDVREILLEERAANAREMKTFADQIEELRSLIDAIPKNAPAPVPITVDPEVVRAMVEKAVAAIPKPRDAREVDIDVVKGLVWKAVSEMPRPEN